MKDSSTVNTANHLELTPTKNVGREDEGTCKPSESSIQPNSVYPFPHPHDEAERSPILGPYDGL